MAVAGHIAGIVQERTGAAGSSDHRGHQLTVVADHRVHAEEHISPAPLPSVDAELRRSQVPEDLNVSQHSVSSGRKVSPLPESSFGPRLRPTAPSGGSHLDVGDEYMADVSGLSDDVAREGRGRGLYSNNEHCSSTELSEGASVSRTFGHSDMRKCSASRSTSSLKPSPRLAVKSDELLTAESLSPRPFSTPRCDLRPPPAVVCRFSAGPDVNSEPQSGADSCSDVWVPRTPSAAEAVSGFWIVCDQMQRSSNCLRSARYKVQTSVPLCPYVFHTLRVL